MFPFAAKSATSENRRVSATVFSALRAFAKSRAIRFAALLFVILSVTVLSGCITEDESLLPWGAPSPSDGSVNVPRSLRGE